MLLVVADTGPLRYLVEIRQIEVLPRLFATIYIPEAVHKELSHRRTPETVRLWAKEPPPWLNVLEASPGSDPALSALDEGEQAALTLGLSLHADLILIDDRRAALVAASKGFEVTGTLGLLARASMHGLVDLRSALEKLKATNFCYRQDMLDEVLKKYGNKTDP